MGPTVEVMELGSRAVDLHSQQCGGGAARDSDKLLRHLDSTSRGNKQVTIIIIQRDQF